MRLWAGMISRLGGEGKSSASHLTLHVLKYILQPMKSMLIELDDELARRLERVAPARSRRRSEFIRRAILTALWDIEEKATAEAYKRHPDDGDAPFDPTVWEGGGPPDGP